MKSLVAIISLAAVITLLAACGGGGGPSVSITLEGDFARLPPGTDLDEIWDRVEDVLERRLDTVAASGDFSREGQNRLTIRIRGIAPDEARELLGNTGQLEFRVPLIDELGQVVCQAEDGSNFSVPPQWDASADVTRCTGDDVTGEVIWEPASGVDSQGVERVLTGAFLRPNAQAIDARRLECQPGCVAIEFTGEGALLSEQITTDVVGLPLGVFLDEELIDTRVTRTIYGGRATIGPIEPDEARTLASQLNAGVLPIPVRVVEIVTPVGEP